MMHNEANKKCMVQRFFTNLFSSKLQEVAAIIMIVNSRAWRHWFGIE